MYPVSLTSADASSDLPESEGNSGNKGEGGAVQGNIPGGSLQQVESPTAGGVSTKGRGKASAKKRGTAAVSSSAAAVIDPGVLSALGVTLSPDSVQIIANLFSKISEYARRFYDNMTSRQLPSRLSDELSLTGQAIWCDTYREMCKDVFVSMCICEYHAKHRSDLIHALPRMGVLSDSSDHGVVPLTGDILLTFLSRLDCAVLSKVESIFSSCWNEAHVSLEGEALNSVSCEDFTKVLDTAGIPEVALSVMIAGSTLTREINKGTIKRTASGVITAPDLVLSSQSHSGFSLRMCSQSESQLGSAFPPGEASGSELSTLPPVRVRDSGDGSSSDLIVAERHAGSCDVSVSTHTETDGTVRAPVWRPPVISEEGTLPSSAGLLELNMLPSVKDTGAGSSSDLIVAERHAGSCEVSVSTHAEANIICAPVCTPPVINEEDTLCSASIPSYVKCVDSLGVRLHPDSTQIVYDLFCDIRVSFMTSFSRSISHYILATLSSKLSVLERLIWFKTYRELHLSSFVSRCLCMYHSRYRPTFIRALAGIRLLSGSSDRRLVSLSGGRLVDFLSRLDYVVRELAGSIFSFKWDMETCKAYFDRESGSLSNVSCDNVIRVLDVAGVPAVAFFSVFQKYMTNKNKASVGSSKIASEGIASRGGITGLMHSSSLSMQFRPELPSQSECEPLSKRRLSSEKQLGSLLLLEEDSSKSSYGFIKLLYYRYQTASLSDVATVSISDESSSNIGDDVLVSDEDSSCSEFGALGESSSTPSSIYSISSSSTSESSSSTSEPLSSSTSEPLSSSTSEPHYQSVPQLGSLLPLEEVIVEEMVVEEMIVEEGENSDQSSSRLVEFSYGDRPASVPDATDTVPIFVALPEGPGSSLPLVVDPVAESNVYSESLSPAIVPESLSSFECEQLPIFTPFLQHHWLEKLD
ncbi:MULTISPECIES: hypothetical protein [Candidatus Ichthyocystis]|uniref:hypothetical protein n=1 Tax=Candidatus Ichthyocystis TaxID=2929841 RepID=UPI000B83D3BB|nr:MULTISPECIES: hypothetical protein [Ichthyocystis]